jgi:hypothetical protein
LAATLLGNSTVHEVLIYVRYAHHLSALANSADGICSIVTHHRDIGPEYSVRRTSPEPRGPRDNTPVLQVDVM